MSSLRRNTDSFGNPVDSGCFKTTSDEDLNENNLRKIWNDFLAHEDEQLKQESDSRQSLAQRFIERKAA